MSLEAQLRALPGDVALASAFMSYAGPFPSQYREDLAKHTWQKQVGLLCTLCVHCSQRSLQHPLVTDSMIMPCDKHVLVGVRPN